MFEPFPKIPRLRRGCTITEKIDGTNAQVLIMSSEDVEQNHVSELPLALDPLRDMVMFAGSRTRLIYPGKTTDNFGFAAWVRENSDELFKLGEGRHFGEWWGRGIQRGYGLADRRFSLFNIERWRDGRQSRPLCCEVVPVLYEGPFTDSAVEDALRFLRECSDWHDPAVQPEGIVVYHHASRTSFKVLLENDDVPKGELTYPSRTI